MNKKHVFLTSILQVFVKKNENFSFKFVKPKSFRSTMIYLYHTVLSVIYNAPNALSFFSFFTYRVVELTKINFRILHCN